VVVTGEANLLFQPQFIIRDGNKKLKGGTKYCRVFAPFFMLAIYYMMTFVRKFSFSCLPQMSLYLRFSSLRTNPFTATSAKFQTFTFQIFSGAAIGPQQLTPLRTPVLNIGNWHVFGGRTNQYAFTQSLPF